MRKIFLLMIPLTLVFVCSLVNAQRMTPFERMDRNGDGDISRQEFRGPDRAFHNKDSNGNGYLSLSEMRGAGSLGGGQNNYSPPLASELLYVDTHNHIVGKRMQGKGGSSDSSAATQAALETMDSSGVQLNFIMPMPQTVTQKNRLYIDDILPIVEKYPDRFALLGGGGSLNVMIQESILAGEVTQADEDAFDRTAAELIADGIVGFGEMTAEHLSMRTDHPYTTAPPDHPLFLRLADLAAKYNVPIDLHMEAIPTDMRPPERLDVSPNPQTLKANIPAFERLLEHNRQAKIVWVHLGWDNTAMRTVELMNELLARHSNFYMSVRIAGGMQARNVVHETFPLDSNGQLKDEWFYMFKDFPDRFVIGSDEIIHQGNSHPSKGSINATVGLLNQLPDDLRKQIGYENAYNIYKINRY